MPANAFCVVPSLGADPARVTPSELRTHGSPTPGGVESLVPPLGHATASIGTSRSILPVEPPCRTRQSFQWYSIERRLRMHLRGILLKLSALAVFVLLGALSLVSGPVSGSGVGGCVQELPTSSASRSSFEILVSLLDVAGGDRRHRHVLERLSYLLLSAQLERDLCRFLWVQVVGLFFSLLRIVLFLVSLYVSRLFVFLFFLFLFFFFFYESRAEGAVMRVYF